MPQEQAAGPINPEYDQYFEHRQDGTDTALGKAMRDQIAASIHRNRHHRIAN